MDTVTRRRFIVIVVLLLLVSAAWIVGYILTRPVDKPVPEQAITLPETTPKAPIKSIEGLSNLNRDGFSFRQTTEIEANLEEFLATLSTTKLIVDVSASKRTLDTENNNYVYRFSLLSDSDTYSVEVLYISSTDAFVRVFSSSGALLYTPALDEH